MACRALGPRCRQAGELSALSGGRAADIVDVPLILGVPLKRRCDGPRPPRSGAISAKGASEEANGGSTTGLLYHAQAGIVSGLWRYPVKSMAGEALASTDISWAGLAGDRRWAFVRPDSEGSGFPWHTIREFPEMSHFVALLGEPARPDRSRVLVRTPDGGLYDVTDPQAGRGAGHRAQGHAARPRRVRCDAGLGHQRLDGASPGTLAHVPSNELRFRPNVVVTLDSGAPFEEDEWVGSAVRIGAAVVRMDRRDDDASSSTWIRQAACPIRTCSR